MQSIVGGLAWLVCVSAAWGQVDLGLLTPWEGGPEGPQVQGGVRGFLFGDSETDNSDADFDLSIYEARGRYRLTPLDEGAPTVGFRLKYLDLDTNDPALPQRLVDQAVAYGMGLGEHGGWRLGFTASVGYAGNNPFADGDAIYVVGNFVARRDLDDKSELRLMLNYDGNRSIFPDIPLPLIAYTRHESDTFTWTVGFPFVAIKWKIDERLQLTARYSLPLDGEVLLEYTLHEDWTLFGGYDSSYDAFRLDGDEHDRLFFRQRRVEAGVRWSPIDHIDLELAGGYAFDQEFESGWDVRDTDNVAEVDAAPFVRVAVTVEF